MPLVTTYPGVFGPYTPITFTRASSATYFDSTGTLQTATTNTPRLDYNPSTLAPLGFLIEEARTNSLRNNTMQGAAAGSPGTAPTNWSMTTTGGVITRTIVGTGTENGVTYIDAQYQFSGAGTANIVLDSLTQIAAASGQSWTASSYVKLVAGSYTNVTTNIDVNEYNSGGSFLAGSSASYTATTSGLTSQRPALTRALNQATTAFVAVNLRIAATGAADITLRIGLPQLEQGAFATSVIPTTTTAVTRAADVASVNTLSPWFNAAASTVYFEGTVATVSDAQTPYFWSISDNTKAFGAREQIAYARNASSVQTIGLVATGGVTNASVASSNTAVAANTVFKSAASYATNDVKVCVNGLAPATTASATLPSGLNILKLGAPGWNAAAVANAFYIRRLTYYPRVLTAAELQTLTS